MIPDLVIVGPLLLDEFRYVSKDNPPLHPGGSALYAALGASLLGIKVGIVAKIGSDYPEDILENFRSRKMDLSGLKIIGPYTSRCVITMDEFGVRTYTHPKPYPSFEEVCLDPADIPQAYSRVKAFHVSPFVYSNHMAVVQHLRREYNPLLSLDPVPIIPEAFRPAYLEIAQQADFFLPSLEEYPLFTTASDEKQSLQALARPNMTATLLKRGARGILAYDIKAQRYIEVPPMGTQNIVDSNGAGDTFCGAFLAATLLGHPLETAIKMGSVAASFNLEGEGPLHLLTVTAKDYALRLQKYCQL